MAEQPVRIAGLASLRKDLKAAERYDELAEIGAAFGEAAELIRVTAKARMDGTGRRVDAKLADTYRVTKSKVKAQIRYGDNAYPFLIGNEWGAHRDRTRPVRKGTHTQVTGWRQFPEVTKSGRGLYPAAAERSAEIVNLLADAVERALTTPSPDSEGE